ncbi:putative membrane protein YdjX (TVP38/TMEM64 family) [Scopulibacillus darangshiensis]|uniref:TVP38/TMEM64 family membrane protein n=1 Tax=Scopulibacillus darangshiensis TaxID=442528 RepID=A0A4R2P586_9BACL|nr:TVP38/TMEM64 family protein [Scopulibacillus darangshiensis]TCP29933.1 putative membrane protein YdjX (TVP38/TMEM64 family) [Scopulibacillus darangshiensis]
MKTWPKWFKIVLVLIVIAAVLAFNRTYLNFNPNDIRDWILSFGLWAPLIYVIIYSLRPFILFPASVLSIVGGLAFGTLWGTVFTVIGATGGAILSFLFARRLGKNIIGRDWKGKARKLQKQLEKNGFFYVLSVRLIPLFNFDLISYSAGISNIRFSAFLMGTIIGILPGTFAYNFLGNGIGSGSLKVLIISILVFAVLTVIPVIIRKKWM